MFGDSDGGYVLDLGGAPGDVRGWLAEGAKPRVESLDLAEIDAARLERA